MKVELITIGDEMLIGQIIDSNSAWMAQQLNDFGLAVVQITSIPDAKDHILKALELASKRADVILITGGLGPTKDDITKATLCAYFKTDLVLNEKVLKHVQAIFDSFGVPMQDVNKSQAQVPANCEVISNRRGTAPGMWFNENDKIYVSMPGVPYEMKAMMTDYVIPKIQSMFNTPHIVHKTIRTQGLGESFLAERIADWENSLEQEGIKLAYLPSRGIVKLRLSTSGQRKSDLLEKVERKAEELKEFIGSYIFGYEDDLLESVVGNLLTKQGKTISTAESCTGGYIAHLITSIPGSSSYFKGSVVAYRNEIKEDVLKVDPDLFKENGPGAVSEEVVRAMAGNIRTLYNTDYAISCSGIAGPEGGSEHKPVGTVWICIASEQLVIARVFQFGNDRNRTIRMTALTAMNMLRKILIKKQQGK